MKSYVRPTGDASRQNLGIVPASESPPTARRIVPLGTNSDACPASRRPSRPMLRASTWSSCLPDGNARISEMSSFTQPLPGSEGCGR